MFSDRRLRKALTRAGWRQDEENTFKAYLGKGDAANTVIPVDANGNVRHGYIWARIAFPKGLQARVVINRKVSPINGYPVFVKRITNSRWEVEGSIPDEANAFMEGKGLADVPPHTTTHGAWGSDPLYIFSQQLNPLGLQFGSGLTVTIDPLFYRVGSSKKYYAGGTFDVSSYLPAVGGGQRVLLISLDTITNDLVAYTSGIGSFSSPPPAMPYTGADVVGLHNDSGILDAHAIRLYNGQTVVDRTDYIQDARSWLDVGALISEDDPGAVGAGVIWFDQSGGAGAWVLKVRNDDNDDWEIVGSGTGGGFFALTDLSNLAATAINTDLIPAADGGIDVGSASKSIHSVFLKFLNFQDADSLTIASDAITLNDPSLSRLILTPESGDTDDLETISSTTNGSVIFLSAATGKTISLKETDNIALGGVEVDITEHSSVPFMYVSTTGKWQLIGLSPGNVNHNDLSGLQGGTASEYYHLTQAQHGDLTDGGDSTLHFHSADRSRANHTGTQASSTISDFNEAAQDAVGGSLTDSASVDFTYDDSGGTITAAVLPAGVDHNALANLATGDPHTQYALLAGRAGGQTLIGGTGSGDDLTLTSTSHGTKGNVFVSDAEFMVRDDVDPTKAFQFQVSGVSAGQTRIYTVPNADTTLVGTDVSQTLTNKAISGASNTLTNIAAASIVPGTFGAGDYETDGALFIDGAADVVQLTVQGNGTQTALLAVFENNSGVDQITFSATGAAVFNEAGNDVDFRVESDTLTNAFVVDGEFGNLGIGFAAQSGSHVFTSRTVTGTTGFNGVDANLIITPSGTQTGANAGVTSTVVLRTDQTVNATTRAVFGTVRVETTSGGTFNNLQAGLFQISGTNGITGTLSTTSGLRGIVSTNDLTVTTAIGADFTNASTNNGVITTATGHRIIQGSITGTGSITTMYALQIGDHTIAGTNYAIETNAGLIVFNQGGHADADVRFESDTDANQFYLDAGNNAITIGSTTELAKFAVDGNANELQFVVQGHSTQTSDLTQWQLSTGTVVAKVDDAGNGFFGSAEALALTLGTGAAGIDYQFKVDGETNDGLITWMEDEDYWQFGDDINLASGEVLKVNGTQVVTARIIDARIDDAINSGDLTTDGVIDALRDIVIAHGLGAAS